MKNNRRYILVLLFLSLVVTTNATTDSLAIYCSKFNDLNTAIRDGKLKKEDAKSKFQVLMKRIDALSPKNMKAETPVFPLMGYDKKAVGGANGNGYLYQGYDYFDGNRHKAHPAHDIFINDKNQDSKDDKTGKDVGVVACLDGVVVAAEPQWEANSQLRGGKYIMVYVPAKKLFLYYAHNSSVLVDVGTKVTAGQLIAYCGRTGLNAAKKRSPTHLHFMVLSLDASYLPHAWNSWVWWK